MKNMFMGFEVSEYAKENGYVDYRTLAEAVGDMVLCNSIGGRIYDTADLVQGSDYEEDNGVFVDIFQYYIISGRGAELLEEVAPNELVYYDHELNIYIWAITHYGTSWDYVLTDIEL